MQNTVDLLVRANKIDESNIESNLINSQNSALSEPFALTEKEKYQLIEWNNTIASYSSQLCIHQLFETQVDMTPNAVALDFEDQQLSYKELNRRANQLANFLIEDGVKPDGLVGLCLERSFEMVIGILGILKAGCAYVPLDPDYPAARLEYMLEDAKLPIVLTQIRNEEKIKSGKSQTVCLDDTNTISRLNSYSKENPKQGALGVNSKNLAYVIYTSGSTGNPKGVMVEHQGLVNRIEWMRAQYGCDSSDAILQKTPFSFDVSVWEFFLPLISGASLIMAKPGGHKDPIYLSKLIQRKAVTKLHFVPSMLNAILASTQLSECKSLKQVFCSGEALLPNHVDTFFKQGIEAELHNLYGPTEASIDVSYWACSKADSSRNSIPIGRPIHNIQLYIIDQQLQLAAPGVSGELCIGGVGLARGYLNRPELTVEKFISNPFSNDSNMRIYKTGDLCRYLPDGNIEFIGRIDHQVKIRGFRIELGEIENTLIKHDAVRDAAVLSKDLPTGKCLVAYVVRNDELLINELREYLEQTLPDYMVPSNFVLLPELPLTSNGKVDRKALASMELNGVVGDTKQATEMSFLQNEVYRIWQQILGRTDIGVDDDLFKVGGDSIAAIQILTAINDELSVNIYVEEIFSTEHFSIRWLADLIEAHQIKVLGDDEYSALLSQIEGLSEEEVLKLLSELPEDA